MKKLIILLTSMFLAIAGADAQTSSAVNNSLYRAVRQLSSPQGRGALSAVFDNKSAADNLYSELKYSSGKNVDWSKVNYVDGIAEEYTSGGKKQVASALILQLPAGSQYTYIIIYCKSRDTGGRYGIVKSSVNWSRSDSIDSRALAAIRKSLTDISQNW